LSVTNVAGEFNDNVIIIGASSNAQYLLTTFDPLATQPEDDVYDNSYIKTSADAITNFSEINPFGQI
jgi:hypothetical protein